MTKEEVFAQRRAQGEANYRKKFEEFGLTERFQFIQRDWSSDHGKRFLVRCKTCGVEFLSWNEVFKGRQAHLLCPSCGAASDGQDIWVRTAQADAVAEYYVQGHTVTETANKFGVSKAQINNLAKKRGLTNGKDWHESRAEKQREEAEKRLSERVQSFGFAYLGGYSAKGCKVEIQCEKCGTQYERTADFLKKGNVVCAECKRRETRLRREEAKREAKRNAEIRKSVKKWYRAQIPPKNTYEEQHEAFLNRTGVCEICGKPYTVREYVKSCSLKRANDNGVCSDECRMVKIKRSVKNSHKGRRDSHRHRADIFNCEYDNSVTLQRLIKRDGLRCALCGKMCDLNDHSWSEYAGPMYPSIDHIIPMSKGGGHTWDNVQVAHIICNSKKGDSMEE